MRNKAWLIVIGALLLIAAVSIPYLLSDPEDQFAWSEDYGPESDQPYGGQVLKSMLEHHKGDDFVFMPDTIYHTMDTLSITSPATYFYYGRTLYLDSAELASVLDFVSKGNKAFISSKQFNWPLFDTLFHQSTPVYWNEDFDHSNNWSVNDYVQTAHDTSIFINYGLNQEHELKWLYYKEVWQHRWAYFYDTELATGDYATELGSFNYGSDYDYTNFVSIPFGEGEFLLHTTPEAFTNYHMLDSAGFAYSKEVLAHLNTGTLLWDEHNRFPTYNDPRPRDPNEGESPLSFIQSEPALRAALYVILLFVVLYLILGLRRKQKAIPVLIPNDNTSIEFSEVVSQLYLNKRDHRKLGLLKMKLFHATVLERYGIRPPGKAQEEIDTYAKRISIKSNIPKQHLDELMDTYRELTIIFNVDNALLVRFHKQLEYFYQNRK